MYKLITDARLLCSWTFINRDGKITNNFQRKPLTRDTIQELLSQRSARTDAITAQQLCTTRTQQSYTTSDNPASKLLNKCPV